MKTSFKGLKMAISMFSIFPVGKNIWDEEATNLVMVFFPIVGGIIGVVCYIVSLLINNLNFPNLIKASFIMLCPLVLSGFLHVDGLMDTCDAIFSRRNLDEKRRILKDPLVGAFGVIAFGVYLVFCFSSMFSLVLEDGGFEIFLFVPMLSRSLTSIFLLNLKPISSSGYGAAFKKDTNKKHTLILVIFTVISVLIGVLLSGINGFIISVIVIIFGVIFCFYSYRQLDGISGDLCGFIITLSELSGYLSIAILKAR